MKEASPARCPQLMAPTTDFLGDIMLPLLMKLVKLSDAAAEEFSFGSNLEPSHECENVFFKGLPVSKGLLNEVKICVFGYIQTKAPCDCWLLDIVKALMPVGFCGAKKLTVLVGFAPDPGFDVDMMLSDPKP